jgi:hypothetical protein
MSAARRPLASQSMPFVRAVAAAGRVDDGTRLGGRDFDASILRVDRSALGAAGEDHCLHALGQFVGALAGPVLQELGLAIVEGDPVGLNPEDARSVSIVSKTI